MPLARGEGARGHLPVKRTLANGYGQAHKRLRKHWDALVKQGGVCCTRCRLPIQPDEPWDLDHDDIDRTQYRGPSHRKCNRATRTHKAQRRRKRIVRQPDWWQ